MKNTKVTPRVRDRREGCWEGLPKDTRAREVTGNFVLVGFAV